MAASKATRADESGIDKSIDRVADNVKNFVSSQAENAADGVNTLADRAASGVKSVAHVVPQAQDWAGSQLDQARERVRAEPIKMMAIAAGVGAVLGALFLRR